MSDSLYGFDFAGISTNCGSNAATESPETVQSICAMLNGTLTGATYVNRISDLKMRKGIEEKSYSVTSPYISNNLGANVSLFHAYILPDGSIFAFPSLLGYRNGCSLPVGMTMKDSFPTGSDFNLSDCYGFIDVNGVNLPNVEVSCSSGSNSLTNNTCIVKNDAKHMTDVFPVRVHDGIVEPATAATRYVLKNAK